MTYSDGYFPAADEEKEDEPVGCLQKARLRRSGALFIHQIINLKWPNLVIPDAWR